MCFTSNNLFHKEPKIHSSKSSFTPAKTHFPFPFPLLSNNGGSKGKESVGWRNKREKTTSRRNYEPKERPRENYGPIFLVVFVPVVHLFISCEVNLFHSLVSGKTVVKWFLIGGNKKIDAQTFQKEMGSCLSFPPMKKPPRLSFI